MYRVRLRSFNNPRTNRAAHTIQRWYKCLHARRVRQRNQKSNWSVKEEAGRRIHKWMVRQIRLKPVNDVDPITLEPPTPPVFKHINSTGKLNAFDARTLATYLRTSGNFIHPVTREPFTRLDVLRLQNLLPPHERDLLDQMPQLTAARHASLTIADEIRVAETAAQIILESINELSMVTGMQPMRQLRLLYSLLLPDLLMILSSVSVSYGTEAAMQIATGALTWLEAQQLSNAMIIGDASLAHNMVNVLDTTRREVARVAADLESLNTLFRSFEMMAPLTISAIVF